MTKPDEINFLQPPSDRRLRREIQNIADSYSHPWDILSELIQNSVDAIRRYNKQYGQTSPKQHKIEVTIEAQRRLIAVRDSGVGFGAANFGELLAPHGTDKEGDVDAIGQKGVGLTYTIFTCNMYEIETHSTTAAISGRVQGAVSWRLGHSAQPPKFQVSEWREGCFSPQGSFTSIKLSGVEQTYPDEEDLFHQSASVLAFILRTRTAVGWVKHKFGGEPLSAQVTLNFTDLSGHRVSQPVEPTFFFPDSSLANGKTLDLDDFRGLSATFDDRQKARRLQGKAISKRGAADRAGKRINYYAFFAPSRQLWKDISDKHGLYTTNEEGQRRYLLEGGIYVATKGMPTSIQLDPPSTGFAGYWPNFMMILEDDTIVFDLGRKSIPSRTKGLLRDIAKSLFNEFAPFVGYATSDPAVTATSSTVQYHEKTKEFETLRKLPGMEIPYLPYLKHPDGQEAAVVAIFHEMVAAGILKGYRTLRTGYRQTYDLWGSYSVEAATVGANFRHLAGTGGRIELPVVVEFKYSAEDVLDDVEKNRKFFMDIDLIVCWDLDEKS
jgi:molecular chaperone HtpG